MGRQCWRWTQHVNQQPVPSYSATFPHIYPCVCVCVHVCVPEFNVFSTYCPPHLTHAVFCCAVVCRWRAALFQDGAGPQSAAPGAEPAGADLHGGGQLATGVQVDPQQHRADPLLTGVQVRLFPMLLQCFIPDETACILTLFGEEKKESEKLNLELFLLPTFIFSLQIFLLGRLKLGPILIVVTQWLPPNQKQIFIRRYCV